ncbi:MAG: carboxypeptidase regulatory-like domain-containing protein [Bryobacterales bacterium]|nr:carboxypeptidase regulatory-like domain-containing protein [Bryobacterales bacterium]
MFVRLISALSLLALCASSLFGQGAALGSISGRVVDPTDSAIPSAAVLATNAETGARYTGSTTTDGFYTIRFVQPGKYSVEVSHPGFTRAVQPDVLVAAASNPTVNLKLTIGSTAESITVQEKVGLVETENADRGGEIDRLRTLYTPTTVRVVMSILPSAPGVMVAGNDRGMTPSGNSGASGFMINGGQDRTNEMLIDGVANRTSYGGFNYGVIPTQEAVSEVKVISNAYSAEYGSTTGGVINVTTRSGTNEFHGEVFSYFRNTALNANTFERNLAGQPRTRLIYNTYGGVLSGPIFKNKLFGTFRYFTNQTSDIKSYIGRVPTERERNGDFSQTYYSNRGTPTPFTIYDPFSTTFNAATGKFTRTPMPGAIIPSNRINPVAKALWQYIPLPNSNPLIKSTNYIPVTGSYAPRDYVDWMPRVDWNVSDRTKLMFRYTGTNFNQYDIRFYPTAANINAGFPFTRNNNNAAFDFTRTMSPTSVLNIRAGMSRYSTGSEETDRRLAGPKELNFSTLFQSQSAGFFPIFSFGGSNLSGDLFSGAGVTASSLVPDQVNNFDVNWSKVKGRHNIKTGGQVRMERIYMISSGNDSGFFAFNAGGSNGPDPQVAAAGSGDEVASFLFGVGASGYIDRNAAPARQMLNYTMFVQDDFKLTPKLTISAGLRWDKTGGLTDRYNALTGTFDPNAASPLANAVKGAGGSSNCPACANLRGGLTFPGVNGAPRAIYNAGNRDFGPRIAVAYALDHKTALRSGYGFFYGPIYYDPGSTGFSQQTQWVTYDANLLPANTVDNPFPSGIIQPVGAGRGLATNIGTSISYIDPNARAPRSRQFSFEVQRELPWSIRFSAAYVNNIVSRLPVSKNLNSLTEGQYTQGATVLNQRVANPFAGLAPGFALNTATLAVSSLITPYPQFTSVNLTNAPLGCSRYDGLQLYAVKRLSQGISYSISYAWSKKLERMRYQWDTDAQLEKILSPLDLTHIAVFNFAAELPFGKKHSLLANLPRWADSIIGGWQANAIIRLQTGKPIELATNAIPTGADPNDVPGGQNWDQWINPASFTTVTNAFLVRRWSTRYNNLRSPGIHRFDMSVNKKVSVTEKVTFELTAIATNVMNTSEFWDSPAGSGVNPASAAFGKISGFRTISNAPRQLQLGARVFF